jgi:hypothetical protein
MLAIKQTGNGGGAVQSLEAEMLAARGDAVGTMSPEENRGGVGIPGGFTNTNDDPRAGGAVVLPGGIPNTSFCEEDPHPLTLSHAIVFGTEFARRSDSILRLSVWLRGGTTRERRR